MPLNMLIVFNGAKQMCTHSIETIGKDDTKNFQRAIVSGS